MISDWAAMHGLPSRHNTRCKVDTHVCPDLLLSKRMRCAEAGGLDSFVLPMMLGSIGALRPLQFQTPEKHYGASITLIARRSTQRIGTRHWRRGADSQACFYWTKCCVMLSAIGFRVKLHCLWLCQLWRLLLHPPMTVMLAVSSLNKTEVKMFGPVLKAH